MALPKVTPAGAPCHSVAVRSGPLDRGQDAEAPIMEVNARVKVELSDVARAAASSIAEAIGRLAREGFVRSFQPVGFLLWCPSCETSFDPRDLVVRVVVAVGDAMVLGLHDPASGARGSWVLTERSERDAWLLTRLVRSPGSGVVPWAQAGAVA